jgi:DNA-binding response OmpR family regulator
MSITIMVVDDDPSIVHMMKENLSYAGYQVLEAYDGETAVRVAKATRPQLILMDLNMPGIGGVEAFRQLRAVPETCKIPVLFLTGEASVTLPPELSNEPAVGALPKTLELDQLNKRIAAIVSTPLKS